MRLLFQGEHHPDIRNRGQDFVLDASTISLVLESYSPHPKNFFPILLDLQDDHGFGLRLAVQAGTRFLGIVAVQQSRDWWGKTWLHSLMRQKFISSEQV